jgi:hypothetical protein
MPDNVGWIFGSVSLVLGALLLYDGFAFRRQLGLSMSLAVRRSAARYDSRRADPQEQVGVRRNDKK